MSIVIQHNGSEDTEEAEQIASWINSNTSYSAFTVTGSNINISSFDGIIVVGGPKANDLYDTMMSQHGWASPEPEYNPILDYTSGGVVTETVIHDGTPVQGIAGHTKEDTNRLVEAYLGQADFQDNPFNMVGAGIDNFINTVNDQEGSDGDDIEDPADPIVDPEPPEDDPEPSPSGERHRLVYTYGGRQEQTADELLDLTSEQDILDRLDNNSYLFPGWEAKEVDIDTQENRVEIVVEETGSITLMGLVAIISIVLGALGVSFTFLEAKKEETKQKELTQDQVGDAEEKLTEMANDESLPEEDRQKARQALIELLNKSPEEINNGGGSGLGGLAKNMDKLIIGVLAILVLQTVLENR